MPCTLQPWEIEIEEKQARIRKYGMDIGDPDSLTRMLCLCCQNIDNWGFASDELKTWWKAHQRIDRKKRANKG